MADTTAGPAVERGRGPRADVTVRQVMLLRDSFAALSSEKYRHALRRPAVREALHRHRRDHPIDRACSRAHAEEAPTMTLMGQVLRIWAAGGEPAELLAIVELPRLFVTRLIALAPRCLDRLDTEEQALDGREDELQLRRRIRGLQPTALREEAELAEQLVAVLTERALTLRQQAERLERRPELVA